MSDTELVSILTQAPFVAIFAVALVNALRRPRRATFDIALLFGAFATIVVSGWIIAQVDELDVQGVETIQIVLLVSLPYLLLRVVSTSWRFRRGWCAARRSVSPSLR